MKVSSSSTLKLKPSWPAAVSTDVTSADTDGAAMTCTVAPARDAATRARATSTALASALTRSTTSAGR